MQLATMIAISFYRAFLLGATAAYMNLAFPAEHFGRLYGLTRLSAALCVLFVPIFYDYVLSQGDFDISCYFFIIGMSKFVFLSSMTSFLVISYLNSGNIIRVVLNKRRRLLAVFNKTESI